MVQGKRYYCKTAIGIKPKGHELLVDNEASDQTYCNKHARREYQYRGDASLVR